MGVHQEMRTAILASRAFSPIVYFAALLSCAAQPAFPQLVSHPDAPIRIAHYHLNVTSVAAHKKFWADTLGGKAMKLGSIDVIEFPDAFIFLRVQKPTGPTRGAAFDHIGFAVPDVPAMAAKLAAAGYRETTGREPKPGEQPASTPKGDTGAAASGTSAVYGKFGRQLTCLTRIW
jgi:hypothetical protein